jgi:hypothetical protein
MLLQQRDKAQKNHVFSEEGETGNERERVHGILEGIN